MNIYVGNLSYEAADDDLRQAFSEFGEVTSASVIKDKFTGRSRGFGFVEMTDDTAGKAAIAAVNGKTIKGRAVTVNEAQPRRAEGGRPGPRS